MFVPAPSSAPALFTGGLAGYGNNLNYRSPSLCHTGMGINVDAVRSRSLEKRYSLTFKDSQLNFTHGVASGDPYSGYFELHIRKDNAEARYAGCPTVATRNGWELPLANFTVRHGGNHLSRPIAGAVVETGYIRHGSIQHTNMTLDTKRGEWKAIGFEKMVIRL